MGTSFSLMMDLQKMYSTGYKKIRSKPIRAINFSEQIAYRERNFFLEEKRDLSNPVLLENNERSLSRNKNITTQCT